MQELFEKRNISVTFSSDTPESEDNIRRKPLNMPFDSCKSVTRSIARRGRAKRTSELDK